MKKHNNNKGSTTLWIVLGILLIIAGIGYYLTNQGDESAQTATSTTATMTTNMSQPKITRLSPSGGISGIKIKIIGTNFDRKDNEITFGVSGGRHHPDGSADNVVAHAASADGKTLTFTIPTSGPSGILCSGDNHCVGVSAMLLQPGKYLVSVITSNGTSNSVQFTITP